MGIAYERAVALPCCMYISLATEIHRHGLCESSTKMNVAFGDYFSKYIQNTYSFVLSPYSEETEIQYLLFVCALIDCKKGVYSVLGSPSDFVCLFIILWVNAVLIP